MKENQRKNYMRAYISFISRLSDENLEKEFKEVTKKLKKRGNKKNEC